MKIPENPFETDVYSYPIDTYISGGYSGQAKRSEVALMKKDVIEQVHCLKCGYVWWPKTPEKPRVCPNCKSAWWDIPPKRPTESPPPEGGESGGEGGGSVAAG